MESFQSKKLLHFPRNTKVKPFQTKWIIRIRPYPHRNMIRIVRGDRQKYGIGYHDISFPLIKKFQAVLALIVFLTSVARIPQHIHIDSAFINPYLNKTSKFVSLLDSTRLLMYHLGVGFCFVDYMY